MKEENITPELIVLSDFIHLCCSIPVQISCVEANELMWEAFRIGKAYRDAGGKE